MRWLQDVRRSQRSTVSRRLSVVIGLYRVCVIDSILPHSPADYVRRPVVPPESPTLGLGHLQFEALITTARQSSNPNDFALIALLGRSLRRHHPRHRQGTRAPRPASARQVRQGRPRPAATSGGQGLDGPILRNTLGARMDRHAATRRLKHLAASAGIRMPRMHPHMLRPTFVTTMLDAGVSLRDVQIAARHADPRTTMRYDRARKNLDRHPNYILAAYMASRDVASTTSGFADERA
ncbi:tyrosine-type recombinase/integrase [Micromonospora sp. NPDC047738]|uniref:tyrosine-type recombinase/integrase n=1 Tax=Micromonospora sp. NPDC047738 TaxID=3155741 RepID=UPI0033E9EB2F